MGDKPIRFSKIKKPELWLKIDKPYLGGEIRNKSVIIELPKRKSVIIRQKKFIRNPNRVKVFSIPMKEGNFSIIHYKDSNTFHAFYSGGVHYDSCPMSEDFLLRMLRYIYYYTVRFEPIHGFAHQKMNDLMQKNVFKIRSWKKRKFNINKMPRKSTKESNFVENNTST